VLNVSNDPTVQWAADEFREAVRAALDVYLASDPDVQNLLSESLVLRTLSDDMKALHDKYLRAHIKREYHRGQYDD
jgi:hypothetical protein